MATYGPQYNTLWSTEATRSFPSQIFTWDLGPGQSLIAAENSAEPSLDSWLTETEIINVYCFKLLNL